MKCFFSNLIKCHHLYIGKNPIGQSYTMQTPQGTITVESVELEKDLGVIIDKSLSFGEHISSKISSANRNLEIYVFSYFPFGFEGRMWDLIVSVPDHCLSFYLGLIFRTFTFMDKDMFLNLYKSLVRPHLEYATSVWSPLYKKDMIAIENIQRRATRL